VSLESAILFRRFHKRKDRDPLPRALETSPRTPDDFISISSETDVSVREMIAAACSGLIEFVVRSVVQDIWGVPLLPIWHADYQRSVAD
jgi:hypothetical protein